MFLVYPVFSPDVCVYCVLYPCVFLQVRVASKVHLSMSEDGTTESHNTGVAPTVRGNWLCVCSCVFNLPQ